MTLAAVVITFYSIYMHKNVKNTIALILCTFVSISSFAQKGKSVKQIASAITKKEISSQIAEKAIQPGTTLQQTALLSAASASVPLTPPSPLKDAKATSLSAADYKYQKEIGTVMNFSLNKKILNFTFALEQERSKARQLAALLQNYQTLHLGETQENAILDKMNSFIINNSLRKYLLDSMTNRNYMQFMRDLANYYSLSVKFMTSYEFRFISQQDVREIFAQTALDYIKTHPHKMNLKMREIMKSPFVSEDVKSTLRSFVRLKQILPQHESGFLTVLREAHKQHTAGLAAARSQEEITQTVEIYRSTLKELEEFIKRYNRSPRWNAPLPERRLYNKLLLLTVHNQANYFKQVIPYMQQMNQLLKQYPRVRWTAAETMQKLNAFIKKYHHFPRVITTLSEDRSILPEELELYETVSYWETMDKSFACELADLRRELNC